MNWRRGLLRTWLALTIIWFVGAGLFALVVAINGGAQIYIEDVELGALVLMIPPVGLFCIGALAYWAAKGFRS